MKLLSEAFILKKILGKGSYDRIGSDINVLNLRMQSIYGWLDVAVKQNYFRREYREQLERLAGLELKLAETTRILVRNPQQKGADLFPKKNSSGQGYAEAFEQALEEYIAVLCGLADAYNNWIDFQSSFLKSPDDSNDPVLEAIIADLPKLKGYLFEQLALLHYVYSPLPVQEREALLGKFSPTGLEEEYLQQIISL